VLERSLGLLTLLLLWSLGSTIRTNFLGRLFLVSGRDKPNDDGHNQHDCSDNASD
jgi:hypothetical protein